MPKEIEIQVRIENKAPLLEILQKEGQLDYTTRQVDEYYTPADRDFSTVRPMLEWLRLRDAEGVYYINYKFWHKDTDGRTDFCDEYETPVKDIEAMRNVFRALKFRQLATVDKTRQAFIYHDWEVSLDTIKDLGDFVEIEYKGKVEVDPHAETIKMVEFLKNSNCGKIERNYVGYPFQLMFPDEVKWEEV